MDGFMIGIVVKRRWNNIIVCYFFINEKVLGFWYIRDMCLGLGLNLKEWMRCKDYWRWEKLFNFIVCYFRLLIKLFVKDVIR